MLRQVTAEFAQLTGEAGNQVRADPVELITGQAALGDSHPGARFDRTEQIRVSEAVHGPAGAATTTSRPT